MLRKKSADFRGSPHMRQVSTLLSVAIVALTLGGCDRRNETAELDKLDEKLGGTAQVGPAQTRPLADQIVIDPTAVTQAENGSANGVRASPTPAAQPAGGPTMLAQVAAEQGLNSINKFAGCSLEVDYAAQWSTRLPTALPLPPRAKVGEAAGSNRGACALRAITYSVPDSARAMAGYYAELARLGGFELTSASEGKGTMLSAWRERDGAAFYAIIQPRAGGASVDLVSNRGS
jgi:hypothetical protein